MRLACFEDFEMESGLYWPPYSDFDYFAQRAQYLADRFPNGRVLVLGAGWGFLVEHGLRLGLDIWGAELSSYAIQQGRDHLSPEAFARLVRCDITDGGSLAWATGSWDAVVSEDVAPMLSREEVQAMCLHARALSGTVLHWVTPAPPQPHPSIVTVASSEEWVELLAPDQVILVGV